MPEVAAALPAVSRDGRTYTFRVRPGFRFSPPSGQKVTAETFRFTIERAASPAFATGGHPNTAAQILDDVVGMPAFTSGRAAHIRGITRPRRHDRLHPDAAGRRLPGPLELVGLLPRPDRHACRRGRRERLAHRDGGPVLRRVRRPGRVVVERNPNYTGAGPAAPRASSTRMGITAAEAVSSVESGRADYVNGITIGSDPSGGPLALGGALERALRSRQPRGTSGQARATSRAPAPRVDAIVFNTRRPLFRDVRMRRAAAYALDRSALARVFGEQPSDRLVPPAVSGPPGRSPIRASPTWPRREGSPDAARGARRRSTSAASRSTGALREIVRSNLAKIGIDVRVDASLGCLTGPETRRLTGRRHAARDLPRAPSPTRRRSSRCRSATAYIAPGYWRDTRLRGQIKRTRELRGAARLAAYRKLERSLVRDAVPVAVYGSGVNPEFFSARVGCKLSQGALNVVDLGALCVHR